VTKAALVIGMKPEEEARKKIDALLEEAGWLVPASSVARVCLIKWEYKRFFRPVFFASLRSKALAPS